MIAYLLKLRKVITIDWINIHKKEIESLKAKESFLVAAGLISDTLTIQTIFPLRTVSGQMYSHLGSETVL